MIHESLDWMSVNCLHGESTALGQKMDSIFINKKKSTQYEKYVWQGLVITVLGARHNMSTRAPFCEAVAIWIKSNVLHIVKSENCPVLQVHLSLNPPTKECLSKYCPGPPERILLSDILEKTILSSNRLATSAASCHLFEPLETT